MSRSPAFWLMKSEPETFSIEDLARTGRTEWDGVRNYQARNYLRDEIKVGDRVLFYHSNSRPSGIAGLAEVVRAGYPDDTAFDPKDPHYDPKSDPARPSWYRVDIKFIRAFASVISIRILRDTPGLEKMLLFRNGRLSVLPVTRSEWKIILKLADRIEK